MEVEVGKKNQLTVERFTCRSMVDKSQQDTVSGMYIRRNFVMQFHYTSKLHSLFDILHLMEYKGKPVTVGIGTWTRYCGLSFINTSSFFLAVM